MKDDFPEEFGGHSSPFEVFQLWFDEAHRTSLKDPNAFHLSTVDSEGQPHSRVLLCKEVRDDALVFYTNYLSEKGQQLTANPKAAINFFWDPLHRQVKFRGEVTMMGREDSLAYWKSRPRASQLSQYVSKQSQALDSRDEMENAIAAAEKEFEGQDIPCPDHWGGYLFTPTHIEFWIGRSGRFHDRLLFTMVENSWTSQRLYP